MPGPLPPKSGHVLWLLSVPESASVSIPVDSVIFNSFFLVLCYYLLYVYRVYEFILKR